MVGPTGQHSHSFPCTRSSSPTPTRNHYISPFARVCTDSPADINVLGWPISTSPTIILCHDNVASGDGSQREFKFCPLFSFFFLPFFFLRFSFFFVYFFCNIIFTHFCIPYHFRLSFFTISFCFLLMFFLYFISSFSILFIFVFYFPHFWYYKIYFFKNT